MNRMNLMLVFGLLVAALAVPVDAAGQVQSACAVSTDPEFGFLPEKPIPTGGGVFSLTARQRRYLSVLRGPAGESVTVAPGVSSTLLPGSKVLIDRYQVTHVGREAPVALYFNGYAFGTPQAPQGFTCSGSLAAAIGAPPLEPASVAAAIAAHAVDRSTSPLAPIAFAEGGTTRAVVFDLFRLMSARASAQGPGIPPPGVPPASVVVAYPVTCNGDTVSATAIDVLAPSGQPMQKVPGLPSGPALAKVVPGAALPQGAVAAMFPTPSLPPNALVRITYADSPGCPGPIVLPVRGEESRLLTSDQPTQPAGVTEVDPSVFLQVVLDVDGTFRRPVYLAGPQTLTAAAIEAIGRWKASPARINGEPIVTAVTLRVAFK